MKKTIIFSLLFTFAFLSGCSNLQPGAPLIKQIQFDGQDQKNPQAFLFSLEWQDDEGDLTKEGKNGLLIFHIEDLDQQKSFEVSIPITPQVVIPGTTSGKLEKASFTLSDPAQNYPKKLKVSIQLKDALGNTSNQAWIELAHGT